VGLGLGLGLAKRAVLGGSARPNLLTNGSAFDTAAWTKLGATVEVDAAAAPDGTTTADKLVESAATAEHYVDQGVSVTARAYTFSAYAKAAGRDRIVLRAGAFGTAGPQQAAFTLTGAGAFATLAGAPVCSIIALPDGWYRCAAVLTATSAQASSFRVHVYNGVAVSYAGDGASGVYVWDARLVAGGA
jgi:hypothetical protein